jgi:hypothetical protein
MAFQEGLQKVENMSATWLASACALCAPRDMSVLEVYLSLLFFCRASPHVQSAYQRAQEGQKGAVVVDKP